MFRRDARTVGMSLRKEFAFPADLHSLGVYREQAMQFVREYCHDPADEIDLTVALQEALANAILHGCRSDAGQVIHCAIEIEPSNVTIVVRDPGSGFDFERVADPKRFDPTTLARGRGIALMRALVDEVSYSRRGSEVRLSKRMNCGAASPAL